MAEMTFSIADDSPCYFCGEPVAMDKSTCPSCGKEVFLRYNAADMYLLFYDGHIIDARAGGLVLGRHHNEDDIPMLAAVAPGIFQVLGKMQGGEYFVNRAATAKHRERLEEINSHQSSEYIPMQSIELSDKSRVFNTNGIRGELALLIDSGSFIINRAATLKFYRELEELNNSIIQEVRGSLDL